MLTAYVPLDKIDRIQIYINDKKKTLSQIVSDEKPDLAITGTFYKSNWTAACHLKGDEYEYADDTSYNAYGYMWDKGPDIRMALLPNSGSNVANYTTCCHLIKDGKPFEKIHYNPDVGGYRGRTAIGIKDGSLCLFAAKDGTADAQTPEGLRDKLHGLGWESAVMMDGGGKVNFYAQNQILQGSAISQNLILVYLNKVSPKPEDKKMKIYLSPSSQPANLYASGGTNEQTQCNRIAEAARIALERCGFDVKKAPEGQSYQDNVTESNKWGADLHIPIHTNAGGGSGPVVFVYGLTAPRLKFAQPIFDHLNAIAPAKSIKGVREYPGLYEVGKTSGTCVYCECAFHDNAIEAEWIIDNAITIGEAICKGVCAGAGVAYVEPAAKPTGAQNAAQRLIDKGWGDVLVAMAEKV